MDKCFILVYRSAVPSKRHKMACVMRVRRTYNHRTMVAVSVAVAVAVARIRNFTMVNFLVNLAMFKSGPGEDV